jgi:hypothetical protein
MKQGGKKMDNLILVALLAAMVCYLLWKNSKQGELGDIDPRVLSKIDSMGIRIDSIDSNSVKSTELDRKIDSLALRVENNTINNDSRFMEMSADVSKVHDHLEQVRKVSMAPRHIDITAIKPLMVDIVRHEKPVEVKPVEKVKPKKVSSR